MHLQSCRRQAAPCSGHGLQADRVFVFRGERLRLRACFEGQRARLEPGLGWVQSGSELLSPPLQQDTEFRLHVLGHDGRSRAHALTIPVLERRA